MKKETPRTWHSGPPAPQGAAASRVWNSGPPPHVGWWNASLNKQRRVWRWWNGERWSAWARPDHNPESAGGAANMVQDTDAKRILWTDYYPENARVPRVDPGQACNAGLVKAINMDTEDYRRIVRTQYPPLAREPIQCTAHFKPKVQEVAPTPEEDEAWRAISTGQRTGESRPQNPGARDLAGVSTRDLMTELFRRVG